MDNNNIEATVIKILREELELEMMAIPLTSYLSDIGADSVNIFNIQVAVEKEFNIKILESEVQKLRKVDDLVRIVCQRVK